MRFLLLGLIFLAACAPTGATPLAPSPTVVSSPTPAPTLTATPGPTSTPAVTPTATPSPTLTPSPTATPSPTPDPYAAFTVDALTQRTYGGGRLQIEDTLLETDAFTRYLISYPSDGLTIYGFMNVPREGAKFPVALVLHGYIDPDVYETEAYTTRYADALAEAGYFTLHPNFRNYPPSDDGPNPFRIGYAIDVLNLLAIIREQSVADPQGPLRRADGDYIHIMGHSMGGGVALRVSVVRPEWVRAVVLYAAVSGDEQVNYAKVLEWSGGRSGRYELGIPPEALTAISPINYLTRLRAPVSIHHSDADTVVPPAWSDDLCARLEALNHPVECFTYHGAAHTFVAGWDSAFMQRMVHFFKTQ